MIREISSLADVNLRQIERLGKLFTEEADAGFFDLNHFDLVMSQPLQMGVAKIWVIEKDDQIVGLIGGICSPLFFAKAIIAVEAFWFVEKEHRGSLEAIRLLEHFEKWAEAQKPFAIHLGFMEEIHPEKVKDFYERRGYRRFETVYRKML